MHLPISSLLSFISILATLASAAELGIEKTHTFECTRKTTSGDTIQVHYRGTLAADGSEFDSSYKRHAPLSFKVGSGRVIKGFVFFLFFPPLFFSQKFPFGVTFIYLLLFSFS